MTPPQPQPAPARPCVPVPKAGFGCAALLLVTVLALTAPSALGNSHVFTTSFGSAASTPVNPHPLSNPTDVAVDLSSHDFYVTDVGNHRIEKFDSTGHLLLMFGKSVNKTQVQAGAAEAQQNACIPSVDECQPGAASATSSPGSLNTPTFIEVDNSGGPSAGDVYVADILGNGIVSKFDSTGHLITSWGTGGQFVRKDGIKGIAVNPTGVFIVMGAEYPFRVARYSQSGSPIGAFNHYGFGLEQQGIAVDARERFYRGGNAEVPRVSAFNEAGDVAGNITPGTITGLEIDPMSNDLYVDDHGTFISHFQLQCGESCTPLETFGNGKLSGARGISVDAPSDNVYVANTGANNVAVFDGTGPYTTTGPVSSVGHTTATITGHLAEGGRGAVTGCHFEYGPGEFYEGGPIPCVPGAPYGSEADVSVELTGLQPETTYHYRLVASNSSDTAVGADRTFTPHYVLGVTTEQATNVAKESAELNGSYVGDGTPTTYHFEYGPKETYEDSTPESSGGSGVGPQPVSPALIEGLQPHTTYHYRLVATNTLGTTYGQDLTFRTPDRPGLGRTRSSHVTATTAELHAQIDPRGADTVFHFEYGTSTDYGGTVPIPDEDIGSSHGLQEVSVNLNNLRVGATYHFRVVAENAFGKSASEDQDFSFYPPACPNATVRQEISSTYLPDCRGYELVSPAEAGSVSLFPAGPNSPNATDPARLAFGGWLNSIEGPHKPVNVWGDLYVSTRTSTGWVTAYVGIPGTQTNNAGGPPGDPTNAGFFSVGGTRSDSKMTTFLDWDNNSYGFTTPNPPPNFTPYVWAANGSSLGEWPTATGYPPGPTLNESPDLSHYYFISGGSVTQRYGEYQEYFIYEGGTAYDNDVKAGTVVPIAFDSGGASIDVKGVPQSSTDGSRILMSTAPCQTQAVSSCSPGELYMRVNDSMTYDIAKGHVVQYVGMTADASEVYFTSSEQLTGTDHDTSTDLYLWTEEGNTLTVVAVGNGGAAGDSDNCSATWIEQCGVMPIVNNFYSQTFFHGGMFGNGLSDNAIASQSGDIYFFSPERLDGPRGFRNQPNLYVSRGGAVQYVTTLEPGGGCESEGQLGHGCSPSPIARIQVSPDGDRMAFTTSSRVTAYENALRSEMYTYSPANAEIIMCVSCIPSGATPTSDVWASSSGIFMTNDGRTFFSTKDALVPRDTDGLRDVYEYVAGRAQLISSGTSGKGAQAVLGFEIPLFTAGLVGVSADGVNAYFTTFSSLVPQDHNGNFLKFYDARTNGGFHYVAPPAPCEAADECAGSGSPTPTVPPNRGSADLGTGGNVGQRHRSRRHKRTKHRHKNRKHAGKSRRDSNG